MLATTSTIPGFSPLPPTSYELPSTPFPSTTTAAPTEAIEASVFPSVFTITPQNGFLPTADPLVTLPAEYKVLDDILEEMPLEKRDGSAGLLKDGKFGGVVDSESVRKEGERWEKAVTAERDVRVLTALFRDLTFAASAYLLEPCDLSFRLTKDYGYGRPLLPRQIAVPLHIVSTKLGAKPFMEYAQSYALYNYMKRDVSQGLEYENLDLIRRFSGCQDERGFVVTHVTMVAHSGKQVSSILSALDAAAQNSRSDFTQALKRLLSTMETINAEMETMWTKSRPGGYTHFRTFIMGTKNQPMFPHGVVYEGVSSTPTFYRGESGANDSIIPSLDNFLEVTRYMPQNPLTEILRDFRSYRPGDHRQWVAWLERRASEVGVRDYALKDAESAVLYLSLLDQTRAFRHRHWNFTKEYILKHSSHPTATGGSPIVSWLPNQLKTVLEQMENVAQKVEGMEMPGSTRLILEELAERATTQRRVLEREVSRMRGEVEAGRFEGAELRQ
ncbi:hypothetical protein HDU85_005856 [Gaertneriomyces sp. JEL0708]|nr:hypothetical protein HDU85_005856 [Gaertneriomyces sp. JEL0708]